MNIRNKIFPCIFALLMTMVRLSFSQTVVITDIPGYTTGVASSMLDIKSSTKGLLIPRVTLTAVLTNASPVSSPATGLLVYNEGANQPVGFYYWNGTAWTSMAGTVSADGSETKLNGGTSVLITGSGTTGTPYTINFAPQSVTLAQRAGLSPVTSQLIFCNNCGPAGELQVYNGTTWTNITGGTAMTTLAIGDSYGGGIVAYILLPGDPGYNASVQHGLIAAPANQGNFVAWGCAGTSIATGTAIGTGLQNSVNIDAGCSTLGIAAELCLELVLNGYSDWYLPSNNELSKLYLNRALIGGFDTFQYWSSSHSSDNNAYYCDFNTGGMNQGSKSGTIRIRAIRAF